MKKIIIGFLFICLSTPFLPIYTSAQTAIDDFMLSSEYKELLRPNNKRKKKAKKKVSEVNENEYLALFAKGKAGAERLLEWLGNSSLEYRRTSASGKNFPEYIKGAAYFDILAEKGNKSIKMTVLLPKPKSLASQSYELLPEFTDIEPPKLKIDSKERVTGRFGEADLYFHKDGNCSLLIKLERGGRINLGPSACILRQSLTGIANSIDVYRVNSKLKN